MSYNNYEFKTDIQLIVDAIKKEDFNIINIFANRLISNGYIFDNRSVAIVGFLIKDLSYLINNFIDLSNKKEEPSVKSAPSSSLTLFMKKLDN